MKRLKIVCCILLGILLIIACNGNDKTGGVKLDSAVIGLVQTTGHDYKSKIMWFDDDLNEAGTTNLKYAALGSHFYSPVLDDGEQYLIPQGLGNRKDTKKVISINNENLDITEYPFTNVALNNMAVINYNVYAVNTLNAASYLEKYNKLTKESKDIVFHKRYVYSIIASDEVLYAFSISLEAGNSSIILTILDKDLNIIKELDVSNHGVTSQKYCEDNEFIYTTIALSRYDEPVSKVLKINKSDYKLSAIEDVGKDPNDIFLYKDRLIITNFNPVLLNGTEITIADKDGQSK